MLRHQVIIHVVIVTLTYQVVEHVVIVTLTYNRTCWHGNIKTLSNKAIKACCQSNVNMSSNRTCCHVILTCQVIENVIKAMLRHQVVTVTLTCQVIEHVFIVSLIRQVIEYVVMVTFLTKIFC